MKYTTLDIVVKGYLLQKKYPIHFYIDFLIYAARCFEELHFDTLGNIRTARIPVNDYNAARLPDDYMDWTKIGVENGQFIKPLIQRRMNRRNNYTTNGIISSFTLAGGEGYTDGTYNDTPLTGGFGTGAVANITVEGGKVAVVTVTAGQDYAQGDVLTGLTGGTGFAITVNSVVGSDKISFPNNQVNPPSYNFFTNFYGYYLNYNDHLEYTGRDYGGKANRADSFDVFPERNEIQLNNNLGASYIVLEYISDGSEIDNATQITPYAKSTLEAYINWKVKENSRSYGEGERQRAEQLFIKEHKRLRARMSDLTLNDIRASIYKNSSGAPK